MYKQCVWRQQTPRLWSVCVKKNKTKPTNGFFFSPIASVDRWVVDFYSYIYSYMGGGFLLLYIRMVGLILSIVREICCDFFR